MTSRLSIHKRQQGTMGLNDLTFHFISFVPMMSPRILDIVELDVIDVLLLGFLGSGRFLLLGFEAYGRHSRPLTFPFYFVDEKARWWIWIIFFLPDFRPIGRKRSSCKSSLGCSNSFGVHAWQSQVYSVDCSVYYSRPKNLDVH